VLTDDAQEIVTRNLGFTVSPHEECAVEEAVRLKEKHGGTVTVLTLGPDLADEQLREAMAMGADEAMLLQTDGRDWDPMATATAITAAIQGKSFDVLLFGNESADSGGYQVGIRVAHALDLPVVSGIKKLTLEDGKAVAQREASGGWEVYEVGLPAVFTVKEGINLPRYPSLPGRMRAKRKQIEQITPEQIPGGPEKIRLRTPPEQGSHVEILGRGVEAVPKVMAILRELRLVE
jgi:electron transfer flavoprotein beta subunit